ncbi:hypothetical protein CDD83_2807 [Cordyceps sp. RAO-2017]|nr:hypothetical protein CDD83_2807 [Cordyceps sp. RAO-2017]
MPLGRGQASQLVAMARQAPYDRGTIWGAGVAVPPSDLGHAAPIFKIPGMFGTLLLALPSAHRGGEVVVRHCGEEKVLKTSEATQSLVCRYSDVSHEVLPVTSGIR